MIIIYRKRYRKVFNTKRTRSQFKKIVLFDIQITTKIYRSKVTSFFDKIIGNNFDLTNLYLCWRQYF